MSTSDAMYDQAIEMQQKGDLEGAVASLRRLIEQDPDFALAHSALSAFYSRTEQYDQAIEHAMKVCELEPEDPFSFIALSLICQKAGRIMEAERAMMQARQAQVAARLDR